MDAGASRGVGGQVELARVMDPLQGLGTSKNRVAIVKSQSESRGDQHHGRAKFGIPLDDQKPSGMQESEVNIFFFWILLEFSRGWGEVLDDDTIASCAITVTCTIKRAEFLWAGTYLLGTALKHHVLLALVQPPLAHGPEMKDTVLPLQQLIQDVCRDTGGCKRTWLHIRGREGIVIKWPGFTFHLLLWSFHVGQHPGHVDAVPVQVLEEDVCVASGQRTCLASERHAVSTPVSEGHHPWQ